MNKRDLAIVIMASISVVAAVFSANWVYNRHLMGHEVTPNDIVPIIISAAGSVLGLVIR